MNGTNFTDCPDGLVSSVTVPITTFLPVVGLVYVAEVLSVVIQVIFYKISGGKRLFKMAPLHHHFELCGMSETGIAAMFSLTTALLSLLALWGILEQERIGNYHGDSK